VLTPSVRGQAPAVLKGWCVPVGGARPTPFTLCAEIVEGAEGRPGAVAAIERGLDYPLNVHNVNNIGGQNHR
jgi:hypothetical protein